LTGPVVQWIE